MNKKYITTILEKLDFVMWDRWLPWSEGVEIYGWIDREDAYKDFIILHIYNDDNSIEYSTSSAKYSTKIHEILYGKAEGHIDCIRVEGNFDIKNCIKLLKI